MEYSPKVDPSVMRVCGAEALLTLNEMKETLELFYLIELIKNDDGCW